MSFGATTGQGMSGNLVNSNFPAGFANGVTIQGVPVLNSYGGRVWWVSSLEGADGNKGTFSRPFATVARALAVLASPGGLSGDIIMVKEGHSETISKAGGWTLATSGVQIFGLGNVQQRPRVLLGTSTAASVLITGAGARISNIEFVSSIANLATCLDIRGASCVIDSCSFFEGAGSPATFIDTTAAAANGADGLKIYNNRFILTTVASSVAAVQVGSLINFFEFCGNFGRGTFSQAVFHCPTGFNGSSWFFAGNVLFNLTAASRAVRITSACTGIYVNNNSGSTTTTQVPGSFGSLVDLGGNVSPLGSMDSGAPFVFSTSLVSSTITTSNQVLATVGGIGSIYIDNIILRTDATGLAGGTNFQLNTSDTNGLSAFFAETVANLGANKTVDMTTASVTKQRTVLSTNATLRYASTVANCTGAGVLSVTVVGQRIGNGAVLFA